MATLSPPRQRVQRPPPPPQYSYVSLAQAAEMTNRTVNVYAIVAECSVPRPTRGSDLVCNLTLLDTSTAGMPGLAAGVEMLCFAATAEELPQLRRPGDVIRLHRVKVNTYHDRPQLVGKVGFRGAGFAFCLFDQHQAQQEQQQQGGEQAAAPAGPGEAGAGSGAGAGALQGPLSAPYQHSAAHYHMDGREEGLLRALRHYYATLSASRRAQLGSNPTYLRRIAAVRPREFFDIVARVVAADDSDPQLCLLYIWDGTDALPFPRSFDTRDNDDGPEAQRVLHLLRPFAPPLEHMPDLSGLPRVGTALPLLFPKGSRVKQPEVGSWVKLRNIGARVVQGQVQAFYHRSSRWTPWHAPDEQEELMAGYRARLQSNHTAGWAPDPHVAPRELLTLCGQRQRRVSSLREVLMGTPAATPTVYRVLVRLIDYDPRDPAAMCHPRARCGLPDPTGDSWSYTMRVLVEDPTGQLDCLLFGPDADAFFADLPARDMAADAGAAAEVHRRMRLLLGQGCTTDGGPWMELSLMAYFQDAAHPWQSRRYRIFDSAMRLPPRGPDG